MYLNQAVLKAFYLGSVFFIQTLFLSCNSNSKSVQINKELKVCAELIFKDDFNKSIENWQVEQMEGGKVEVKDGKLEITDVKGCTVWSKTKFDGPIMIEYDVVVIDEGGSQDRVSDLNCFWMAMDLENEKDFFANSKHRNGKFLNYDSLRQYYIGVGGHNNTKTRFRRYRGNGEKPLLPEHDLSSPEYLLKSNKPYHIKIIVYNGYIQYYRNNKKIIDFYDSEPYTSGYFGFRTVNNHMTVDNFKVFHLKGK